MLFDIMAFFLSRTCDYTVGRFFEFRAVFTLLLLPNHPRLDCLVSGLVNFDLEKGQKTYFQICQIYIAETTLRHGWAN